MKKILSIIISLFLTNVCYSDIDLYQNKNVRNDKGPYCYYVCLQILANNLEIKELNDIYTYAINKQLKGYTNTVQMILFERGIYSEYRNDNFDIRARKADLMLKNPIILIVNFNYTQTNSYHAVLLTHIDVEQNLIWIVDPNSPYYYIKYKADDFIKQYWANESLTLVLHRR